MRSVRFILISSCFLIPALPAGAAGLAINCSAAGLFTIYVSNLGNDNASGCLPTQPIKTLERANEILNQRRPQMAVEVRLDPSSTFIYDGRSRNFEAGTCQSPNDPKKENKWSYFHPSLPTIFLPYGAIAGDLLTRRVSDSELNRPRFVRQVPAACEDPAKNQSDYWFRFDDQTSAVPTNLWFLGLEVKHFPQGGISLVNGNENRFYNMNFLELGTKFGVARNGYGGLVLKNSDGNEARFNWFRELINVGEVNDPNEPGQAATHIHAIYLQHNSNGNDFSRNVVDRTSGDPIKFRDGSGENIAAYNSFTRAGAGNGDGGTAQHWFRQSTGECASMGNALNYSQTDGPLGIDRILIGLRHVIVNASDDDPTACNTPSGGGADAMISLEGNDTAGAGAGWSP